MAFTPIELFALIVALLVLIKLTVIAVNPKAWFRLAKVIYGHQGITTVIAVVIAAAVGWHLQKELTIIQIFAVMLLLTALMIVGYAPFGKELLAFVDRIGTKRVLRRAWLSVLIWLILSFWVVWELFR